MRKRRFRGRVDLSARGEIEDSPASVREDLAASHHLAFAHRAQKGRVCCGNLRKRVEATRRAAGIAEWPSNALRHGFVSYHLAHFNDAAALALEMGHMDSGMIFEHYRQLVRPAEAVSFCQITSSADVAEKLIAISATA